MLPSPFTDGDDTITMTPRRSIPCHLQGDKDPLLASDRAVRATRRRYFTGERKRHYTIVAAQEA